MPCNILDSAARPIRQADRDAIRLGAHRVLVLAVIDALEHPGDARPVAQGVRGLVQDADVDRVGALVEPLAPGHAHAVVEALARHGCLSPTLARIAHARIDIRWQADGTVRV